VTVDRAITTCGAIAIMQVRDKKRKCGGRHSQDLEEKKGGLFSRGIALSSGRFRHGSEDRG